MSGEPSTSSHSASLPPSDAERIQQLQIVLEDPTRRFIATSSPYIMYSELPSHWRCKKSLPSPFIVILLIPIPDGTRVSVSAGNDENPIGEVRNGIAEVGNQMAKFHDLRFVGKSGRGNCFHLTITVDSTPMHVGIVNRAIKVTVDGPREIRPKKKIEPEMPTIHRPIAVRNNYFNSHLHFIQIYQPIHILPIPSSPVPIYSSPVPSSRPTKRSSSSSNSANETLPKVWRPF